MDVLADGSQILIHEFDDHLSRFARQNLLENIPERHFFQDESLQSSDNTY